MKKTPLEEGPFSFERFVLQVLKRENREPLNTVAYNPPFGVVKVSFRKNSGIQSKIAYDEELTVSCAGKQMPPVVVEPFELSTNLLDAQASNHNTSKQNEANNTRTTLTELCI